MYNLVKQQSFKVHGTWCTHVSTRYIPSIITKSQWFPPTLLYIMYSVFSYSSTENNKDIWIFLCIFSSLDKRLSAMSNCQTYVVVLVMFALSHMCLTISHHTSNIQRVILLFYTISSLWMYYVYTVVFNVRQVFPTKV